ncbi:MAG TPA: carbohydrate-binding domain-containing protein, partial [Candidatus Sulfotelmatobacter sp.]|nr:carbohydrate-binding domain-containing protein [Candidatus Sulfotelmatobacter sp.]
LGLHYPHEYPDYPVWPNAAWWMDQSIARDWVPGGQWKWDRAKPLYIGEFLWVPSTSAADFTILFGDEAYADPSYYRNLAKGLTWRMQIEAYRAYGVNGICPWTMFEDPAASGNPFDLHPDQNYLYQVQKAAYHPNGVFPEEYNTRFFAGETAQRTLRLHNDRMSTNTLTLRWRAGTGSWQTRTFTLPPAGQRRDTITFPVPAASGSFPLQLELSDEAKVVFTNTLACSAWTRPTLSLPPGLKLGLYDPHGATASLFNRFSLPVTAVTDLRTAPYDQLNLLVIGRDALTNEPLAEVGRDTLNSRWQDFAQRGGWVLVLEQTNYPAWMPAEVRLENFEASFAFPNSDHPVTQNQSAEDLRWWADDHRLVTKALASPARGNGRLLATVGSHNGLEYAAALEMPLGAGGFLCSQWLLTQRFDVEPLAGVLLQRLLNYGAGGPGHLTLRPVALASETNSVAAAKLAELGLLAENIFNRLTNCDPALYPVLVVAGSNAVWQEATLRIGELTSFVDKGGKLLLHQPTSSFLAAAQPVLFPDLDWTEANLGLVLRRDSTNAALRLANHDLYWIEQAGSWNRPELLSTNVARRYYRPHFNLTNYSTIQVESMPVHSTGGASSGGWWLWNNGYVAQNIAITQPGTYLFNVLAKGTPALGGWPQMSLKIDGRAQDLVTVATNQPTSFTLSADLSAGTHELAISFDNDDYAPPEDRNLFLDLIRWGRDSDISPSKLLTRPGAVAQVRHGSGLVVLDEIGWEAETRNATKAGRYASTLLTDLGAAMRRPSALGLEAEAMRNVNVAAYTVSGGIAYLNSGGRIETPVRFTTTGTYTFEVLAGGTAAQGVLPQVAITLDGVNRTNFFLTSTTMTRYLVTFSVPAGTHNVGLAFLNDFYAPPEDRNAAFDRLSITPETLPRIAGLTADPARQVATLQWEAAPGKAYEVQVTSNLTGSLWHPVTTNTSSGNVLTWQDTGDLSGAAPLSPGAPSRYYRLLQRSP